MYIRSQYRIWPEAKPNDAKSVPIFPKPSAGSPSELFMAKQESLDFFHVKLLCSKPLSVALAGAAGISFLVNNPAKAAVSCSTITRIQDLNHRRILLL